MLKYSANSYGCWWISSNYGTGELENFLIKVRISCGEGNSSHTWFYLCLQLIKSINFALSMNACYLKHKITWVMKYNPLHFKFKYLCILAYWIMIGKLSGTKFNVAFMGIHKLSSIFHSTHEKSSAPSLKTRDDRDYKTYSISKGAVKGYDQKYYLYQKWNIKGN